MHKTKLKSLSENPFIAATGRVRNWLNNQEGVYPVSCTTFIVEDSMDGPGGIEDAIVFTSQALRQAAGVALDFSKLRPRNTTNNAGLVASGPVSFMTIFSTLNGVLRRGGVYKNGAVTCYLDSTHPDFEEYLTTPVPSWIKRATYVDENLMQHPLLDLIIDKVNEGTLFLVKFRGEPLRCNVCLEIFLRHRASCLLTHVNLGKTQITEIPKAFAETMYFLCELHGSTNLGQGTPYLSPKEDKQVGMGVIGLANFLAKENVKYKDLVEAMKWCLNLKSKKTSDKAKYIAETLYAGFQKAASIARNYKMERAFTIAPTETCAFNHTDLDGYTLSREIAPPICHKDTKILVRDSGEHSSIPGAVEYKYPPNVETADDVGFDTYFELASLWQMYMNSTGLAHSISFNTWDSMEVTQEWLQKWMESPLYSLYYRYPINQNYTDKTSIFQDIEKFELDDWTEETEPNYCEACAE